MKKEWVAMDAWRGCYKPVAPKGWTLLINCSVVNEAGERLGEIVKNYLKKEHIKYRSGYLRTSNVFSAQYYILAEDKLEKNKAEKIDYWFDCHNNSTFSIFSGEEYPLEEKEAKREFKEIIER